MPVGLFHQQYWAGPSGPVIPPQAGTSGRGGYTTWQTSVVIGSLFGALQMLYERLITKRQN